MHDIRRCPQTYGEQLVQVWNMAGERIWPAGLATRPRIRGSIRADIVLRMPAWVKSDPADPTRVMAVPQPVTLLSLSPPAVRLLPEDCLASRGLHLQGLATWVPETMPATDTPGTRVDLDSVDTPPTPPAGATQYGTRFGR